MNNSPEISINIDTKEIIVPDGAEFAYFVPISDVHYGNKYCNEEYFEYVMNWCWENRDKVFIFTNGDLMECASDSRYGSADQIHNEDEQYEYMINTFEKFAKNGNLIGMLRGNHEERIRRGTNFDIAKALAMHLNVDYYDGGAALELRVMEERQRRAQIYDSYIIHGSTSSRTLTYKVKKCADLKDVIEAEMYIMGHVHELFHQKQEHFRIDRGRCINRPIHIILSGSYLNYGGYGQKRGYAPVAIGSPKIKLHTNQHRISVHI